MSLPSRSEPVVETLIEPLRPPQDDHESNDQVLNEMDDLSDFNLFGDMVEYVGEGDDKYLFHVTNLKIEDSFLRNPTDKEVPRLIVIDVPNILHASTPLRFPAGGDAFAPTPASMKEQSVDAIGLLALVRFFTYYEFECCLVTSHKYMMRGVTDNHFIIEELEKLNMVVRIENHTFDDLVLFEVAHASDGVILSNDKLRDHVSSPNFPDRYRNLAQKQRVDTYFGEINKFLPQNQWHTLCINTGHLLVHNIFSFRGSPDELRKKFYSTVENKMHELVVEQRSVWVDKKRKDKIMKVLDKLMIKAVENSKEKSSGCGGLTYRP